MPTRSGPRTGFVVLDAPMGGAVISRVVDDSPATKVYHLDTQQYQSLLAGQVIVECNGRPVADAGQLSGLVAQSPQIMRLKIRSGTIASDYLMRLRY